MRIRVLSIVIALLLLLIPTSTIQAHSGRTDSSGGHNCSEKSKAKGLCTGYHYHNGGNGSSSSTSNDNAAIEKSERTMGEKEGFDKGMADGVEGRGDNPSPSGSTAYIEAYEASYTKGYIKGTEQFEAAKVKAFNAGTDLGSKQDEMKIPDSYQKNPGLLQAYKDGFNKAVARRDEDKKKEFTTMGYQDGLKDIPNEPHDVKDIYKNSYKDGYTKGNNELKQTYTKQGYEAAFKTIEFEMPSIQNSKYLDWYREGFFSNKEVVEIQNAGYRLGKSGDKLSVPTAYLNSEAIFTHHYELGVETRKQEQRAIKTVITVLVLGWLLRRFYIAWKMTK